MSLIDNLGPLYRRLYDFIRDTIAATGQSPSLREMAAHMRCGLSTLATMLKELVRLKIIRWLRGRPRGVELLDESRVMPHIEASLGMISVAYPSQTYTYTPEEWRLIQAAGDAASAQLESLDPAWFGRAG